MFVYLSRKHKPIFSIYYRITMFMLFVMVLAALRAVDKMLRRYNVHTNIFIWLLETFAFGFSKDKSLLCSKMIGYLTYVNVKIASDYHHIRLRIASEFGMVAMVAHHKGISNGGNNVGLLDMNENTKKMKEKPPKRK